MHKDDNVSGSPVDLKPGSTVRRGSMSTIIGVVSSSMKFKKVLQRGASFESNSSDTRRLCRLIFEFFSFETCFMYNSKC